MTLNIVNLPLHEPLNITEIIISLQVTSSPEDWPISSLSYLQAHSFFRTNFPSSVWGIHKKHMVSVKTVRKANSHSESNFFQTCERLLKQTYCLLVKLSAHSKFHIRWSVSWVFRFHTTDWAEEIKRTLKTEFLVSTCLVIEFFYAWWVEKMRLIQKLR